MRWPWQRRAQEPADEAATGPAQERPRRPAGEWRDLPALQAVSLADATTDADPLRFVQTLATRWQVPPALEQLGHRHDVTAPSGAAVVAPAPPQVGYADAPVPVWPTVPDPAPAGAPVELPPTRPLPRPVTASEPPTSLHAGEAPVPASTPSQPAVAETVRPLVGRTSLLTLDPADLREVAAAPAPPADPGEQVPPPARPVASAPTAAPSADRSPAPRPSADAPATPARPATSGVPDWFRSGTLAPAEPQTEPTAPPQPAARTTAQQPPAVATSAPEPVTLLPPARPRRVPWPQVPADDAEPSDQPADEPDHDEPADAPADAPADGAAHEPGPETDPEPDPVPALEALDEPAAEPQPLADGPLADLRHPIARDPGRDPGAPPHHAGSSDIRRREGVAEAGSRTIRGQRRDATHAPELPAPALPAPALPGSQQRTPGPRTADLPRSEPDGAELDGAELDGAEPAGVDAPTSTPVGPPRAAPAAATMPVRRVLRVGAPLRASDQPRDGSSTTSDGPADRTERAGPVQGLAAFVAAASAAVPDDVRAPGVQVEEPGDVLRLGTDDAPEVPAGRRDTAHLPDPVVDAGAPERPDVTAVLELLRPRDDDTQGAAPRLQDAAHAPEPDVPWWATPDEHGRSPRDRDDIDDLDHDDLDHDDLDDDVEDASAAAVYDQVVRRLRRELLVERERAALLAD